MQLFYVINGWAGHNAALDTMLRFFYVSCAPLLATALLALIFLWPQRQDGSVPFARRRIFYAFGLSLLFGVLVVLAINALQSQVLNGANISPRPAMTHWTNLLVVEPNGNSFPCYEVMFAAGAATLIWSIIPTGGIAAWFCVFLLGFARTFCGSNWIADSVAGALLGAALSTLALALCRVSLRLPAWDSSTPTWRWRLRHQGAISGATLLFFLACGMAWLWSSPAHGTKLQALLQRNAFSQSASATPKRIAAAPGSEAIHEGEGVPSATRKPIVVPGQMLLDSGAMRLDGHLPEAETYLHKTLSTLSLPHRLIGINVAQVHAGTTAYRAAAIRFEITGSGPAERARVAQTAAALTRRAFNVDAQLQHVDIMGMQRNAPASDGKIRAQWRPLFTASVERRDLIIRQPKKPKWVNDPRLEGGLWLRARSALFIDSQVLPAQTQAPAARPQTPKPALAPKPKPTPTPAPQIVVPPVVKPVAKPAVPKPAVKPPAKVPASKPATTKAAPTKPAAKPSAPKPAASKAKPARRTNLRKRRPRRTRKYRYKRYRRYRSR